jgi:hypothetical protein
MNCVVHLCALYFMKLSAYLNPTPLEKKKRKNLPLLQYASPVGWTVRGSNPGGGEIFRTRLDRPWGPPSLLYNGYRVFPGGKSGRGVVLTTHPLLATRSRKSRANTSTPLWAFGSVTRYLYLYQHALCFPSLTHDICPDFAFIRRSVDEMWILFLAVLVYSLLRHSRDVYRFI